jgi:DNA primase
MPGIRYADVRARVTMAEVLGLLGFVPCATSGDQVRGPCPVHHSATPSSRSFSANRRLHIYRCFKCGSSGNHLDLYAAATGLCLFEATVRLCEQLHREVPWMQEERSLRPGGPMASRSKDEAGRADKPAGSPIASRGENAPCGAPPAGASLGNIFC